MEILSYIAFLFIGIYCIIILSFTFGWLRMKLFQHNKLNGQIFITIVVACRNEESNISHLLNSLSNQNYAKENTEIIIVDDHSEDNTAGIIEEYIKTRKNIKLLKLPDHKKGKKEALELAIKNANSDVIITTDADCTMQKNWIDTFVKYYIHYKCKIISGPVLFNNNNIFQKLQTLEFMSLVGSGAGAISINRPIMNNGANLLFEKSVFLESNQNKNFASGDDIFLMLHAKRNDKNSIHFLKSKDAIVTTQPAKSIKDFINQRARWTSKSKGYKDFDLIFTALTVSITNLMLTVFLISSFFNKLYLVLFLQLFIIKSFVDLFLLIPVSKFFNQLKLLGYFLPLQFIYPFYITITTILGLLGNFQWKNRSFKEKR